MTDTFFGHPGHSEFFSSSAIEKIDKKYVHKAKEENVVIGNISERNDSSGRVYECNMAFDNTLPFFFEHFLDHVPGLLITEGVRQMGTAICHLFYDVDFDHSFILDFINTKFINFSELHITVILRMIITDAEIEAGKGKTSRKMFRCKTYAVQDGNIVAEVESHWQCIPKKVIERMRLKRSVLKIGPQGSAQQTYCL